MSNSNDTKPCSPPPHSPPRTRFGIRGKFLIGLTVFNVIISVAFTVHQQQAVKDQILDGLQSKLRAAATAMPLILPDGYIDRAVDEDSIPKAEYLDVLKTLSDYCELNNLVYLYTYFYKDGFFYCTSTNATPEEWMSGDYTPFFDLYIEAPPSMREAIYSGIPAYEVVTDRWGTVLTLFMPKSTEVGTRYVVGADIDIGFVDTLIQQSRTQSIAIGASIFMIAFVISAVASSRFSIAIKKLASYTEELSFSGSDSNENSALRGDVVGIQTKRNDEIGTLAHSFLLMEDRLARYLEELATTTAIKERIENELKLAGEIQLGMLPHGFDPGKNKGSIDLSAFMKPAREAGGDLYDYFFIDDDHLCFAVGDVSGKGIPAALFMTVATTVLRANANESAVNQPDLILTQANDLLSCNNKSSHFITLFIGIFNIRTGVLTFADGGHNRPYLIRKGEDAKMLELAGGTALGIFEGLPYSCQQIKLNRGDCLFVYSDGITEAFGPEQSLYGEERLERILNQAPENVSSAKLIDDVLKDIEAFRQAEEQSDDITVLALSYPLS